MMEALLSTCLSRLLSRINTSQAPATPATMAVGQHTVRADKSIPLPTWTRPQAGWSISVQKRNNLQGWQVHIDAAARAVFSYS